MRCLFMQTILMIFSGMHSCIGLFHWAGTSVITDCSIKVLHCSIRVYWSIFWELDRPMSATSILIRIFNRGHICIIAYFGVSNFHVTRCVIILGTTTKIFNFYFTIYISATLPWPIATAYFLKWYAEYCYQKSFY